MSCSRDLHLQAAAAAAAAAAAVAAVAAAVFDSLSRNTNHVADVTNTY